MPPEKKKFFHKSPLPEDSPPRTLTDRLQDLVENDESSPMFVLPENKADYRSYEGLDGRLPFQKAPIGTMLFRQDDQKKVFIFLKAGMAKVTRITAEGGQMITELLLPGDVCGALCALDSCPYPVSAEAVTEVQFASLSPDQFFTLSQDFPQLQRCSLEGCASKIREQRSMMLSIALERIPQRLWKIFLVLAQRLGEDTPRGLTLPFPFSRQEVADMIGATPETITRAFTKMKKDAELFEDKDRLTLLGIHHLEEVEMKAAL